jgi:hypothetical protein
MAALDLAAAAGESPDAYIINAIGNTQNSLQRWAEARESYLTSSQLFQQAKVGACKGVGSMETIMAGLLDPGLMSVHGHSLSQQHEQLDAA